MIPREESRILKGVRTILRAMRTILRGARVILRSAKTRIMGVFFVFAI
jgi:hypothetical protein